MPGCGVDRTPLDAAQTWAALGRLPDWRSRLGALHTAFRAPTPAAALALVAAVGAAAEQLDHHPDVDWRHRLVFLRTTTHSVGGQVTAYDVELAGRASALAAGLDAEPVPQLSRSLELAVDAADPDRLRAFWAAALDYREAPDGSLYDPYARGPWVWFQQTDTPSDNRLHLDLSVSAETADDTVGRTVAAGGRADPAQAPAFTVLTDPDGNRVCICTPLGRDHPA